MKITNKKTFVIGQSCGTATAKDEGKRKYLMLQTIGGACAVLSETAHRYALFEWDEIISLAIDAGIDLDEDKEVSAEIEVKPAITHYVPFNSSDGDFDWDSIQTAAQHPDCVYELDAPWEWRGISLPTKA